MINFAAIVILFFSIVVHEYFHGYVALKCGDETAKYAGRLTFNPIPHIDIFGTIILPLFLVLSGSSFLIGWAKPVPVNPYNFRNPGIDGVKVAAAGPLSNLSLAVAFSILTIIIANVFPFLLPSLNYALQWGILINLYLAVFNLIPVHPLDGSHILHYFLPYDMKVAYSKIQNYGFLILLLIIMTPLFGIIHSIVNVLLNILYFFINMFLF